MNLKLTLNDFKTVFLLFDKKFNELNEDESVKKRQILCGVERLIKRRNRAKYLNLFEKFLKNEIESEQFCFVFIKYIGEVRLECDEFCQSLRKKIEKSEEVEVEFQEILDCLENIDYKRMSLLLSDLYSLCDLLTFDEELYQDAPNYYLNEENFRKEAKSIITQLLFYLKFM